MKVFFSCGYRQDYNGPHNFMCRLYDALPTVGAEVTTNKDDKHDVSLHLVVPSPITDSVKVSRVDGAYHHYENYKEMNSSLIDGLKTANAIVYQSEFSKKLCDKFLGHFDATYEIIHNGADKNFYDLIAPAEKHYEHNFICSAHWGNHKRPIDTIESFLMASVRDSCLYISGPIDSSISDKYRNCRNVIFLGNLSGHDLGSYYKMATSCIHISRFDACPNSVIEPLVTGCPVITNNIGGTREIVSKCGGIICDIDQEYDFEPVDLYNPPPINRGIVAEAIVRMTRERSIVTPECLYIENVARKYKEFFGRNIDGI